MRYDFGIDQIRHHTHRYGKTRLQTLAGERRLLRRWEAGRGALHAAVTTDISVMKNWQLERLSQLVDHAYLSTSLYNRIYRAVGFRPGDIQSWSDFERLPIIGKDAFVNNFEEMLAFDKLHFDEYYLVRSSGSSGRIASVIRDENAVDMVAMYDMRQFERMMGGRFERSDWRYLIYIAAPVYSWMDGYYPIYAVSQDCDPEAIIAHLRHLRPKFISTFPSFLARLAARGISLSQFGVQGISTNSEPSTRQERDKFQDIFDVKVLDEYSSEELCHIASECEFGGYHIVEDNVYLEFREVPNTTSQSVIGTHIHNAAMPIIRYEQGDLVSTDSINSQCPCGSCFRKLQLVVGRSDDRLVSKVKGAVPSDVLMSIYDSTLISKGSGISELQIVQLDHATIELYIVPDKREARLDAQALESFRNKMKECFGDCDLAITHRIVDELPRWSSHKRRMIVNRIGLSPVP